MTRLVLTVRQRAESAALAGTDQSAQTARMFDQGRLEGALNATDWAAVTQELDREIPQDRTRPRTFVSLSAWPALDEEGRRRVLELAIVFLQTHNIEVRRRRACRARHPGRVLPHRRRRLPRH